MAIRVNLAMTGAEIRLFRELPGDIAWMACHFSSSSSGLSNLPRDLPPGSLLVVDDQTPIAGHDQQRIAAELSRLVRDLTCRGVLLDFQRPEIEETADLAAFLDRSLPCPVAVSSLYAQRTRGPVFLPPLPCHAGLEGWLWPDRENWLELSLDREVITLTEQGAVFSPGAFSPRERFCDENLRCHYTIAAEQDKAVFHLWRTREDLNFLLLDADVLGVPQAVGLFQELGAAAGA